LAAALSLATGRSQTPEQLEQARIAALLRFPPPPDARLKGRMYAQLALRYAKRQRLNDAIRTWEQAAVLNHLVDRAEVEGSDRPAVGYTHIAD
jgi:hypothetical protein